VRPDAPGAYSGFKQEQTMLGVVCATRHSSICTVIGTRGAVCDERQSGVAVRPTQMAQTPLPAHHDSLHSTPAGGSGPCSASAHHRLTCLERACRSLAAAGMSSSPFSCQPVMEATVPSSIYNNHIMLYVFCQ